MNKISDDEILSLWRTVRPSREQNSAMVYEYGLNRTEYEYELNRTEYPSWELRRLVELSIEYGKNIGTDTK